MPCCLAPCLPHVQQYVEPCTVRPTQGGVLAVLHRALLAPCSAFLCSLASFSGQTGCWQPVAGCCEGPSNEDSGLVIAQALVHTRAADLSGPLHTMLNRYLM